MMLCVWYMHVTVDSFVCEVWLGDRTFFTKEVVCHGNATRMTQMHVMFSLSLVSNGFPPLMQLIIVLFCSSANYRFPPPISLLPNGGHPMHFSSRRLLRRTSNMQPGSANRIALEGCSCGMQHRYSDQIFFKKLRETYVWTERIAQPIFFNSRSPSLCDSLQSWSCQHVFTIMIIWKGCVNQLSREHHLQHLKTPSPSMSLWFGVAFVCLLSIQP